jgi:predicted Ser/Thr protein kinase
VTPTVVGPYAIERELGRGAMGVVYAGRHVELGRPAAIKLLLDEQESPDARQRFQRECEALARLGEHPGIVRLYDHGVHQGLPYVSLELVAGAPLDEALTRSGPWDEEPALQLGLQLCEALEFAHQAGILHRDLKPANVLLDETGRARVTDFGLAKDVAAESMTNTGQLLGTPSYMPPEQASGDRAQVGPRSDVYGLGATLFCVFTGQPPFSGQTLANVVTQIFTKPPPAPSSLRPRLNPAIDRVILRALAKAPKDRYASAAELGAALQAVLDGEAPEPPSRALPLAVLAAVALVVALVAGTALATQGQATPTPTVSQTPTVRQATLALRRAKTAAELQAWLRDYAQFLPDRRERVRSRLAELTFEAFQEEHSAAKAGPDAPTPGDVRRIKRHLALRAWAREHLESAPRTVKTAARQELSDPGPRTLGVFRQRNPEKKVQLGRFLGDERLQLFGDGRPSPSWNLRTGEESQVTLLRTSSYVRRLVPERRGAALDLWSINLRTLGCLRSGQPLLVTLAKGTAARDLILLKDQLLIVGSRPRDELEGVVRRRGFAALIPRSAFRPGEEPALVTPEILKLENMALCAVRHPTLQNYYVGGGAWVAAEGREYVARLTIAGGELSKPQDIVVPGSAESIAISPDGTRLAVGLNRGGARVYPLDPRTGAILTDRHTELVPSGKVMDPRVQTRGLCFLSDGRLLMTSKLFDARKLEKVEDQSEFDDPEATLSLWSVEQQLSYRVPAEHDVAKSNPTPKWSQVYPFVAYEIAVSPNEALVALGTESYQVVVVAVPE